MQFKTKQMMTVEEAAKFLRNTAELTARNTQNWDNYQRICLDMLKSAIAHVPTEAKETGDGQ